jgi:hypothetical protein
MLMIVVVMLLILGLAALVITFAAYPNRGQQVPKAPWLGEALNRAVDAMPNLENPDATPGPAGEVRTARPAPRSEPGTPKGSARAS